MTLKTIGKKLLKIILIIVILLFLVCLAFFIHHQITKESVDDYLPMDAQAYIQIDSLKELYNDIIDLKALEIIFTQEKLSDFFYSIIDFKNTEYSKSYLFQEALNLKTYIILQNELSPSLIIDPGLKGIVTRHIPLVLNRLKHEDIQISTSVLEDDTVYGVTYKGDQNYYIVIKENLILISVEKDDLVPLLKAKKSGESIITRNKLKKIDSSKVKNSILNLFVDTDSFLADMAEAGSSTEKLLSMIDFPSLASLSIALTNESVNLKISTEIVPNTDMIKDFLGHKASPLGVISTLPDTTNIYTSVNFKSFKDLYGIISTLQDDFIIEDYDGLIKLISGLSSDDILFSWTGSDAGLFTIETAPEPVLFIKIAKEKELDHVLESLNSSLVLNVDDILVIDNIRISQFKFPDLIKAGMNIAKKPSTLPYFIKYKDYMFLSMNPETLAQMVQKERDGELLIKEKTYKSITEKTPKNANFFFYYDLNSTLPRFITKSSLLTELLKEYEKGVISLFYTEEQITLNLSAESSNSKRTTLFPGYPKKTNGIKSPIIVSDITGKDSKELIYLNNKNELTINDISNSLLYKLSIGKDASLTLLPDKELLVNDVEGVLYKVDGEGEIIQPFPQFTEAKDSFPPVLTSKGMILYSSINNEIQQYDKSGSIKNVIPVSKTVFSQPLLMGNKLYYYPKSLLGNIYCTSLSGDEIEGWPQSTLGISFSTPFKVDNNIGFLTQKGDLFLWNNKGEIIEGFPVKLDGVFYSTPVVIDKSNPEIAVISQEGFLYLINTKGEIMVSREFDKMTGKDIKLTIADIKDFKSPIIFMYGGSNYMIAVNDKLQILPGFPINGYTKPAFSDINNDGFTEVISAGYDKKLYIYTLRNN